jgi:hypothetical protein
MRDTIDMAREAGFWLDGQNQSMPLWVVKPEELKAFETLVRADEREETNRRANASWTLMCEKMVAIEREACAKVCDDAYAEYPEENQDYAFALAAQQLATTIRNRGNT